MRIPAKRYSLRFVAFWTVFMIRPVENGHFSHQHCQEPENSLLFSKCGSQKFVGAMFVRSYSLYHHIFVVLQALNRNSLYELCEINMICGDVGCHVIRVPWRAYQTSQQTISSHLFARWQSCCSVFNSNNMPLNHCQSLGPDNGVSVICAKEYNSTKFEVYITFHFGFMGPNAKNRRTGSIKPVGLNRK